MSRLFLIEWLINKMLQLNKRKNLLHKFFPKRNYKIQILKHLKIYKIYYIWSCFVFSSAESVA